MKAEQFKRFRNASEEIEFARERLAQYADESGHIDPKYLLGWMDNAYFRLHEAYDLALRELKRREDEIADLEAESDDNMRWKYREIP